MLLFTYIKKIDGSCQLLTAVAIWKLQEGVGLLASSTTKPNHIPILPTSFNGSTRNFTNFINQYSPNQYYESSGQISPTPQSQFHFAYPTSCKTSTLFGHLVNQSPYGHSPPRFPGVQHQWSWLQHAPPSFQAFHQRESLSPSPTTHFRDATSRSRSVLQFSQSSLAAGNTSSHIFESNSQCPHMLW